MQRPSIDGLNTYVICKAVHEAGFKVALSGLGGDEAVGGYSHFRLLGYLPLLRALDRLPALAGTAAAALLARAVASSKAGRLLARGGPRGGSGLALLQREVLPAAVAADLAGTVPGDLAGTVPDGWPPESFGAMAATEVAAYLQPMLLADADAFSMASSVELRVPFVDREVFAAALGVAGHRSAAPGKAAIGKALGDRYLTWLAGQPKQGFSLPMRAWLSGPGGPLAPLAARAGEPGAAVWSVLDRTAAQRAGLISGLAPGAPGAPGAPRERWAETWALVALNAWLETSPGTPA
jgi:asparagine synthase (glutamine-hydrolysing)